MGMGPVVKPVRMWFVVAMCALFALMPLGQTSVSAYQGDSQSWGMTNTRDKGVIIVTRYDTGDVNLNTAAVNQIDAQFVRENLGSNYKRVRSAGNEEPVPGTTVVRRFTFTYEGLDGIMIATDEWGSNIWLFMFVDESLRESEIRTFVSATVQNRYPSEIPAGYGEPKDLDV